MTDWVRKSCEGFVSLSRRVPRQVRGSVGGFSDLSSVRAMRTGKDAWVIGFDTEFFYDAGRRVILSYQFALIDPFDPSMLVEVVLIPAVRGARISLPEALWEVVRVARLYEAPGVSPDMTEKGIYRDVFWSDDWEVRRDALAAHAIKLVLACHYGDADLTAFRRPRQGVDLLTRLTSAAGGLVTLMPVRLQTADRRWRWWQPFSLSVRDTMAHAPAGRQSLAALGDSCGVAKLSVPGDYISCMDLYQRDHFEDFLDYGVNDSVIVVEYLARLYGENKVSPATLSGGAARALVAAGCKYFGVPRGVDFRRVYSGLVPHDALDSYSDDDLSFYVERRWEPLDGAASVVMRAFAQAYHGGMNACPAPCYWEGHTLDLDAKNAYPTAMSSILDIDWNSGVIDRVIHEREITLDDVPSPVVPFVGFVSFEFPESVRYPSIPVLADSTLIYPRTSEGISGEWASAPEVWLALRLGARVFCQIGFSCRLLEGSEPDGRSRVLRAGVTQLVADRASARKTFGKKTLEELFLKTAVNSSYGKTAQDVAPHRAWNAYVQAMGEVGGSAITSPYHACMTTGLVRAQLLAAMNQVHESGHRVFSVTTDGFITDAPLDVVQDFDLYGLLPILEDARLALTGDASIWEAKHSQDTLLNFTTRGNVSLEDTGVCAHAGLRVPECITEDSYEDRLNLFSEVVSRTGKISYSFSRFPSFQELSRKEDRLDFAPREITRAVSVDFDLKRRPDMSTLSASQVTLPDGSSHEVAGFATLPWETVEDAVRGRTVAREMSKSGCLRTEAEWKTWQLKFSHGKGRKITDPQRAILLSIVTAHRRGVVSIPTLASGLSVQEKLGWLGSFGLGSVSRADWDNARRPERAGRMLPLSELEPYLSQMMNVKGGENNG